MPKMLFGQFEKHTNIGDLMTKIKKLKHKILIVDRDINCSVWRANKTQPLKFISNGVIGCTNKEYSTAERMENTLYVCHKYFQIHMAKQNFIPIDRKNYLLKSKKYLFCHGREMPFDQECMTIKFIKIPPALIFPSNLLIDDAPNSHKNVSMECNYFPQQFTQAQIMFSLKPTTPP